MIFAPGIAPAKTVGAGYSLIYSGVNRSMLLKLPACEVAVDKRIAAFPAQLLALGYIARFSGESERRRCSFIFPFPPLQFGGQTSAGSAVDKLRNPARVAHSFDPILSGHIGGQYPGF